MAAITERTEDLKALDAGFVISFGCFSSLAGFLHRCLISPKVSDPWCGHDCGCGEKQRVGEEACGIGRVYQAGNQTGEI